MPVENVVTQNQTDGITADEVFANHERLCKAIGAGLDGVAEMNAELATIVEQSLEGGLIFWRGNDQDITDAGEHQHRQRVDHRMTIDRQ